MLEYCKMALELKCSYEADLELLAKGGVHWQVRMGIVYRSERKRIIRN